MYESQGKPDVNHLISTKYFCDAIRDEAKICMQLEFRSTHGAVRAPHSWCFVVDVSGSMGNKGKDGMMMIERVKLFAGLAKDLVSDNDYITIISFASKAETNLEMTKMDSQGKEKVVDCLHELRIGGGTNIEAGLQRAFQEMSSAKRSGLLGENATLSIVIFTDGRANEGITNGAVMVDKYRQMEQEIGENVHVPISAFTVGTHSNALLTEMSSKLGSEAFYWLDESKNFEADMILPIKLRERTMVNNIQIVMKTMNGATISAKNEEHLLNHTSETVTYFLHMLPMEISKVFQVVLKLPFFSQQRRGHDILDVTTTYRNGNGEDLQLHDVLALTGKSVLESCASALPDPNEINETRLKSLEESSSFVFADGNYQTSWLDVKKAILINSKVELLRYMIQLAHYNGTNVDGHCYLLAAQEMKTSVAVIIQNDNDRDYTKWVDEIDDVIEAFQKMAEHPGKCPGRIYSMTSALARNMPAPTGVLDEGFKLDGKAWIQDINDLVEEAKVSARDNSNDKLDFKILDGILKKDSFARRVGVVKANLTKVIREAKAKLKHVEEQPSGDSNLFLGKAFVLSAQLQNRDEIAGKIKRNRGEVEQGLSNSRQLTLYVVMESDGATSDSALFSAASAQKLIIVEKRFVDDCMEENDVLFWHKYSIKPPTKR